VSPETLPVIEIDGVTKRYRGRGRKHLVQIPGRTGRWYDHRVRRDPGAAVGLDDDLGVDDELDDEEEESPREDVAPSRRDIWALQGVSFDVHPGKMVGIVGPNGSGKSTLLRVITRLTPPTGGRVVLRGSVAPFVPSLPGLMLPKDSLRRNTIQIAQFYAIPKPFALERIDAILELANLTASMHQPVFTLSPGELQRFAFALAVGLEPDVLVADDQLAVGDKHFREVCLSEVRRRVDAGLAVLFASHDLELIVRMCDEVVLIEDGLVVERGAPQAVVDRYVYGTASPPSADTPAQVAAGPIAGAGIFTVQGRPTRSLHMTEGALVEIDLAVDEAPAKLRCTLSLRGPGVVMRAVQPVPFDAAAPGRYVVSALVPAGSLPVGDYRVDVAAMALDGGERRSLGVLREAFSLDVFGTDPGTGDFAAKSHMTKRQLPLEWSVQAPREAGEDARFRPV
jgi:ABC-type polysaccharide/polyol phosphate transport system ATPase subunit